MANGKATEARGNTTTIRKTPSRYGASMGAIPANSTVEFVGIADVVISGALDLAGDTWLKLPNGLFINHVLGGVTYYNILTMPVVVPPPPATGDTQINMTLKADGTITGTWTEL